MPRARTPGSCHKCHAAISPGQRYVWNNLLKRRECLNCAPDDPSTDTTPESDEREETVSVSTGNSDAVLNSLANALADRMQVKAALDEAQVEAIVARHMANLKPAEPTKVEIVQVDKPTVTVDGGHYLLPRLLKLLGAGMHVYLWGPAGSGKTTAAMQACQSLFGTYEIDTLDPSTFRSMLQGYMTPNGEPVQTAFTRCWQEGKPYIGEEIDLAPGHVQTLLNTALANGHAPLAWGNVPRKDGFVGVFTGNTPGRPTRAFPDRKPMSAAFMDRLYFMHWPIDEAIECRAGGLTPSPRQEPIVTTPPSADVWVKWVMNIRKWAETNAPTLMVTPRASLLGLQALELGEGVMNAAHGLVFRGADADLIAKALHAVPLA